MAKKTPPTAHATRPADASNIASRDGTKRFADRWASHYSSDFFRQTRASLTVSSVTLGTYLGESDEATDALYAESIRAALERGINAIDTAINYRCQRAERVIGRVLGEMTREGGVRRDEMFISTKAGYIPLDTQPPESRAAYEAYIKREYFDAGILQATDLVGGGHAVTPTFLIDQLDRSLRNMNLTGVDCLYIHNPEQQLTGITPAELRTRMKAAFAALEERVTSGVIGVYGCATWSGLRLPAGSQGHLSLYELEEAATEVAGKDHHFRMIQLPINLTMSEAVRVSTQRNRKGRLVHLLDAAAELGIDVVASAPLLQGQLTRDLPSSVRELFHGDTDAQRALAFVHALPVLTAAVGMKSVKHVEENLAAGRVA